MTKDLYVELCTRIHVYVFIHIETFKRWTFCNYTDLRSQKAESFGIISKLDIDATFLYVTSGGVSEVSVCEEMVFSSLAHCSHPLNAAYCVDRRIWTHWTVGPENMAQELALYKRLLKISSQMKPTHRYRTVLAPVVFDASSSAVCFACHAWGTKVQKWCIFYRILGLKMGVSIELSWNNYLQIFYQCLMTETRTIFFIHRCYKLTFSTICPIIPPLG